MAGIGSIVVLTGAGISAESGLPVFRGPDGLWEGHQVEDVATPQGFARDPGLVQRFYNGLRRRLSDPDLVPNAAHLALARLEEAAGASFHLITQNIDDLHQRAGSSRMTAMHGELAKIRNVHTGEVLPWRDDVPETERDWRPHVVWFGEQTIGLADIAARLSAASLFIAVGTSGTVYPANRFAHLAKSAGATTIEVNPIPIPGVFDHTLAGDATQMLPPLVEQMIADIAAQRRSHRGVR